jgi:hypothetical protein
MKGFFFIEIIIYRDNALLCFHQRCVLMCLDSTKNVFILICCMGGEYRAKRNPVRLVRYIPP